MVAGLAFLSKKSFNPKNKTNQEAVFIARQQKKVEEKRIHERATQLKREQEDQDLARSRYGDRGGEKASLGFMYAPPPGMAEDGTKKKDGADRHHRGDEKPASSAPISNDLTQLQDGDDEATAAFRAMLAGVSEDQKQQDGNTGDQFQFSNSSGAALQGTTIERGFAANDARSALEKAVGRRDGNGGALTLEEQVARFPQLKHAPMAKGMSATDVQVNFKPLGTQLRNVRCLACGIWGHSRGERECEKSGWNPFAAKPAASSSSIMGAGSGAPPRMQRPAERAPGPRVEADSQPERNRRKRRDESSDSGSDSSSDDSSYERRRRRRHEKKKRKRRKEKKRRRRDRSRSPDDYGADDDYDRKKYREKDDYEKKKQREENEEDPREPKKRSN